MASAVQSGRIFAVDRVPFARFDHDEHDVLTVQRSRAQRPVAAVRRQIERVQIGIETPLRKIIVQRF